METLAVSEIEERFWSKADWDIHEPDRCWEWLGYITKAGYGQFGRNMIAHRLAYELEVGEIPAGLQIDHLCRNRSCVNPDHLEPVTGRENTRRGESFSARLAAQTHCKRGHVFTPENTYVPPAGSNGLRRCRECVRQWKRQRRRSHDSG